KGFVNGQLRGYGAAQNRAPVSDERRRGFIARRFNAQDDHRWPSLSILKGGDGHRASTHRTMVKGGQRHDLDALGLELGKFVRQRLNEKLAPVMPNCDGFAIA